MVAPGGDPESAEIGGGSRPVLCRTQGSLARIWVAAAHAIASTGATSIKEMGKVMGIIKAKAQGRADMAAVGAKIKAKLGG